MVQRFFVTSSRTDKRRRSHPPVDLPCAAILHKPFRGHGLKLNSRSILVYLGDDPWRSINVSSILGVRARWQHCASSLRSYTCSMGRPSCFTRRMSPTSTRYPRCHSSVLPECSKLWEVCCCCLAFSPGSGIHPLRRNGGGVLHGTCTARSLLQPGAQPRGGGSPLLLYLSVSVRCWRRRLEHRREPRPQIAAANRIRTPASSWWPSKAYGSPAWARPPLACR